MGPPGTIENIPTGKGLEQRIAETFITFARGGALG